MNYIYDKIDPWACMPALVMIEALKLTCEGKNHATRSTTVRGFQPLMENILLMDDPVIPRIKPLHKEVNRILDKHRIEGEIHRSWFVSYDKDGYQKPHNHYDGKETVSGIICLLGGRGGVTCFEDREFSLEQGDILLFDSKLKHWTTFCTSPKVVLSFDMRPVNTDSRAID